MSFHGERINVFQNPPYLHMYNSTPTNQHWKYFCVLLGHKVSWIQHISYVKERYGYIV